MADEFDGIPQSVICGKLPTNSEQISRAVLDARPDAVNLHHKIQQQGSADDCVKA